LKNVITEIRELIGRKRTVNINYAHRSVNLAASALAFLNQDQCLSGALVVHFVPPRALETALDLDEETFHFARKVQEDEVATAE